MDSMHIYTNDIDGIRAMLYKYSSLMHAQRHAGAQADPEHGGDDLRGE